MNDEEAGARLRLRVIGRFTAQPAGRVLAVTPTNLADVMASAGLSVKTSMPARLGAAGATAAPVELSFGRPKAFQLADVVAAQPVLAGLKQLADALGGAAAPAPDAVLLRVRELAGDGPLAQAVSVALELSAPPPEPAPAATAGAPEAKVVDAFVRSMRGDGGAPKKGARAARALLEETVFATAAELLRDPAIARLEAAWRSLKLLADQCPPTASASIEVFDVSPDQVVAALDRDLSDDPIDRPDVFVVADPIADVAVLERLADAAEGLLAPVLVALAPSLFGASDTQAISARAEAPGGGLPEAWQALRGLEASRWLCAVVNPIVVVREGVGAAKRVAFGSPSLALASMLAASFRETRSFARILGPGGALEAPGSWELPSGRDAGTSLPTETFLSIRLQGALAAHGVLGLGSGRNTTKVQLSEMPMVRQSPDAAPLSAQVLTGRIARFAQWVCDQVPAGASDQEAASLFEEAAKVFLFAGLDEGTASLRAGVGNAKDGARMVEILCKLPAPLAGIPFQMAFALPVGTGSPSKKPSSSAG